VARRRSWWRRWLQRLINRRRLVFIDETWVKTNMTRLAGWCPLGQRLLGKVPHGHWKTLTLVAALRHDGVVAPWIVDGPINGRSFLVYVREILVPALRPGDIVVLDNLGSHKGSEVRQAIQEAGARMVLLPPYSPDLNPIEQVFAKLKTLLRKQDARTVEATWRAIGDVLKRFPPDECERYLEHAGYQST
jgi:transposase